MIDNQANPLHEGQKVSVSFGIRGDSLEPQKVSSLLGLRASHAFAKGDEYRSVTGNRNRPWGVWQLRSDSHVNSSNVHDHIQFILDQLESKREIIRRYVESDYFYVDVRICFESIYDTSGYTISSSVLARLATICNEFNLSFIVERDDDRNGDMPEAGT